MRYTAEEVRTIAANLCSTPATSMIGTHISVPVKDAITMYEALCQYIDLLERSPDITDEACRKVLEKLPLNIAGLPLTAIRHALAPVWPVAAEPAQPADSGRVTELLAYLDNQAQHPRDQFGNGSNKPNPTLKAWYAKQAATVRALAAQGQPATPILNIRCESVSPDGVKGSTYLPVVRVEAEDDGSFTAVTNYWPAEPSQSDDSEWMTDAHAVYCCKHGVDLRTICDKCFPDDIALAAQTTGVRDEIAEEAWRAFYDAADKVQKEPQSNG